MKKSGYFPAEFDILVRQFPKYDKVLTFDESGTEVVVSAGIGGQGSTAIVEENGINFLRITTGGEDGINGSFLVVNLYRSDVFHLSNFSSTTFRIRWSYEDETIKKWNILYL